MPTVSNIEEVRVLVDHAASSARSADALMAQVVELLHERMAAYNWVGFYMIEKPPAGAPPMLVLGHFKGAATPHTRIPLNQGICGAAASSGETVVIDDVGSDPRYLACSIETKSEIVAPVFAAGEVVGELDIDSHFSAAFTLQDRELVEHCAALVGKRLEESPA